METSSNVNTQNLLVGGLLVLGFLAILWFISQGNTENSAIDSASLQGDVFFDEGRSYFEE